MRRRGVARPLSKYHGPLPTPEDVLPAAHPRPTPARPLRAAALALVLLGLAGCARDLDLPPRAAGPRLTALSPARAYAGELVEIQGTGFAGDPAANRVTFARATTQGVALSPGGLLVRVPADAGSGPVTITTSRGASEPLAGFGYRGLGQLRAGQVVQAAPLLHRPTALFAPAGEPVLDSTLFSGLVGGPPQAFAWRRDFQRPVQGGGALFFVSEGRLWRGVPGVPLADSVDLGGDLPFYLGFASLPAPGRVVAISSVTGGYSLRTWDAATLAVVASAASLPATVQSEPWDVGDGRLALLAQPDANSPVTVALLDPAAPGAVTFLAPPPVAVRTFPLAFTAGLTAVGLRAAVGLADGSVGLASLGPSPGWLAPIPTFSSTPVSALALTPGGGLAAAKAEDGLVMGLSLGASPAVAWALDAPRPSALVAGLGVLWAAGDADNQLLAIDAARGVLLGRRSVDTRPAAAERGAGAAVVPGDPALAIADEVVFAISNPPALVRWLLGSDASATAQALDPELVAYDRGAGRVWQAGGSAVMRLEDAAALSTPEPVLDLRWSPAGPLLVGQTALSLVRGGAVVPLAADLDAPLEAPAVSADGRILAVGSMGGAERARLWTAAGLATSTTAALDVTFEGFALNGLFIDGEPWVCTLDPAGQPRSVRLAADGSIAATVPQAFPSGVASPNGRTVVAFESGLASEEITSLAVVSTDPATGFATLDRIELGAPIVGAAFDDTGERLFVVTRAPDQLLVLE